ncbi:hypothetical protein HDU67_007549 [Dinochytrium kinnereticum]|nr:hypothetical protein HDU67_007549 [Dinochytrium kinnereticum]
MSNCITNAHDAAISCMVFGKDADNSWLITGSFDRVVKLWSLDGNLLQRFDGFSDTITSVCYVLPTQTLWITSSSPSPIVYDPRSGINVSDFVSTNDDRIHQNNNTLCFKHLQFIPEVNEVIGITNRRSAVVWKYNPVASVTVLSGHTDVVEKLAFTLKEPLLIFSGGSDGIIRKWERLQLNSFMYSQEPLFLPKEEKQEAEILANSFSRNPEERRKKQAALHRRVSEKLDFWKRGLDEDLKNHENQVELMSADTLRAFRRKQLKLKTQLLNRKEGETGKRSPPPGVVAKGGGRPGALSMSYYEDLDLLVSGHEDSVWGYNEEAVKYVPDDGDKDKDQSEGLANDSVTNRVAGMTLKYTLSDHKEAVTGLTTGWDRRICIYDLKQAKLHDMFRTTLTSLTSPITPQPFITTSGKEELAADGIILDLEYCHDRNEFGYASADKLAYIRRFSPKGDEMTLQAVLIGHEAEVTQIKWNRVYQQWITGSEDRTIRVWASEGLPLIKVINNDGPVTALCVDVVNGCILTGSQDKCIRVFDPEKKDEVVQKNAGHSDEVRAIIHIPVRNQYVSASWDNTVRIWNGQRRITTKTASAFYANPNVGLFDDSDEANHQAFAELNPLIVPKLLSKPLFIKELVAEKQQVGEDNSNAVEQNRLEEELRSTLNDLEFALNGEDPALRAVASVELHALYVGLDQVLAFPGEVQREASLLRRDRDGEALPAESGRRGMWCQSMGSIAFTGWEGRLTWIPTTFLYT